MTEVTFIGTSDAFGAGGRRQSAILLRSSPGTVLLDCGTTTGTGLNALGIAREEIDAIFVSHFHADHFAGIPLLLLASLYEDRRRRPLVIAGPREVEARVRAAAEAMGHGIDRQKWSFPIEFREIPLDGSAEIGPVRVQAFPAYHQPESLPHGLRVATPEHEIVYSGDTGWFEELPARVRGADLFISECTFYRHEFEYHLSYERILERSADLDCERLILTHLGEDMAARRGRLDVQTADDGLVLGL